MLLVHSINKYRPRWNCDGGKYTVVLFVDGAFVATSATSDLGNNNDKHNYNSYRLPTTARRSYREYHDI